MNSLVKGGMLAHLIWFTFAHTSLADELPFGSGMVPHADHLEEIIKRQIFPNKTDDVSFLQYFGDVADLDNGTRAKLEHLEFTILDRDGLKGIIDLAKRTVLPDIEEDRAYGNDTARRSIYNWNDQLVAKIFDLMKQSIYSTRYRMQRTKPIRKKYHSNNKFNMGIMFGNLMELRNKASNALKTVQLLSLKTTKFLWFLILYERILAFNVDVTSTVNRVFHIVAEKAKREKAARKKPEIEQEGSNEY